MDRKMETKNDIVERFYIPGEEGYSEFWRRDKSSIEPFELAKLLGALRKVASYVGRNVGNIVWSGMPGYEYGIGLDPGPIIGRYPVPPSKTDILTGLTIERSYEKTEWSERFKKLALSKAQLPPSYAYKFNLFFDVCENVYLDSLSNQNVFGCYTEKARQW